MQHRRTWSSRCPWACRGLVGFAAAALLARLVVGSSSATHAATLLTDTT